MWRIALYLWVAALAAVLAPRPAGACDGDCSGDDHVTVDEVVALTAIILGEQPASACGTTQTATIDDLIRAVISSLRGCPADSSFVSKFLFPAAHLHLDDRELLGATDVSGDGLTDVVFANAVWFGTVDGSFRKGSFEAFDGSVVVLGDFDGDGKIDAVSMQSEDGSAEIGVVKANGEVALTVVSFVPIMFAAGDANGDGFADLIALREGGMALAFLKGNGDGSFSEQPAIGLEGRASSLIAGDLNGDGRADLAWAAAGSPDIGVLLSRDDGSFEPAAGLRAEADTGSFREVRLLDVNGDGVLDVVGLNPNANGARLWIGRGGASFDAVVDVARVLHPLTMATGDFDGDGGLDIAMASADEAGEIVVLGHSGKVLQRFTVGEPISKMTAGDVTRDGTVDLLVVAGSYRGSTPSPFLSIIEGKGDGTFRAPVSFRTEGQPGLLAVADFDRDRLPDLAVSVFRAEDTMIELLLRRGDASLESIGALPNDGGRHLLSGDFDGDGSADLAAANYDAETVSVYFGRGDGSFEPRATVPAGVRLRAIVAADFTGDRRDDLVIAGEDSNTLTLFLATPERSFLSTTIAHSDGPYRLAVGDADGDGDADLFASGRESIAVFLSDGPRGFSSGKRLRFIGPKVPGPLLADDLNGDGLADLVVSDAHDFFQFFVFLGNGDGTFHSLRTYPALNVFGILRTGDFNGDTFKDVLVRDFSSSVAIFFGDGKGRFAGPQRFGVGYVTDGLGVVDVDADGVEDLIRLFYRGDGAELTGERCVQPEGQYVLSYPQEALHQGASPIVADLNRDGVLDLVFGGQGFSESAASVLIGLGNGAFQAPQFLGEPRGVRGVAVADLDRDDNLDVVTADQASGTLSIFHGDGAGGFESAGHLPVGTRPFGVVAVDLNRDSRRDLLALDFDTGELSVVLARQETSYEVTATLPTGTPRLGLQDVRHFVASGDFDRNGTIDLAVPVSAPGIAILLGDGEGRFAPGPSIPVVLGQAYSIQALDLNDDGLLDLASTHVRASSISVLLGRGDGTFELGGRYAAGPRPVGFAAADVNADGRTDLLAAAFEGQQLSMLVGRGDGSFDEAVAFPWSHTSADTTAADFDGDGIVDVVTTYGPLVWAAYGMRLGCARPMEPYTVVPFAPCMLSSEDGGQSLSCH